MTVILGGLAHLCPALSLFVSVFAAVLCCLAQANLVYFHYIYHMFYVLS